MLGVKCERLTAVCVWGPLGISRGLSIPPAMWRQGTGLVFSILEMHPGAAGRGGPRGLRARRAARRRGFGTGLLGRACSLREPGC